MPSRRSTSATLRTQSCKTVVPPDIVVFGRRQQEFGEGAACAETDEDMSLQSRVGVKKGCIEDRYWLSCPPKARNTLPATPLAKGQYFWSISAKRDGDQIAASDLVPFTVK